MASIVQMGTLLVSELGTDAFLGIELMSANFLIEGRQLYQPLLLPLPQPHLYRLSRKLQLQTLSVNGFLQQRFLIFRGFVAQLQHAFE